MISEKSSLTKRINELFFVISPSNAPWGLCLHKRTWGPLDGNAESTIYDVRWVLRRSCGLIGLELYRKTGAIGFICCGDTSLHPFDYSLCDGKTETEGTFVGLSVAGVESVKNIWKIRF